MRNVWMGLLCVTVMGGALVGCGDDTEPNTTSNTGSSSSSTGGETGGGGGMGGMGGMGGAGGQGGGTGGAGGQGGGMMSNLINGCDPAKAEDHTKDMMTTVNFGGAAGTKYVPPCIKIKMGSQVTFSGNFMFHPTVGGTVTDAVPAVATPDPNSPIKETKSGMSATFAFDKAGDYPYYCTLHYGVGMKGAVFVVQ